MNAPTPKYLLIGGAPKSATTSLFNYLADHPDICPANRKETYFFAREFDYKHLCTVEQTAQGFASYFSHCQPGQTWWLEATPYTLYAPDAAQKIAALLPGATMLFILRDPVERLISNYFMQIQRQVPSVRGKTVEAYIDDQFQMKGTLPNSLLIGRYMEFIRPFIDTLSAQCVQILFFEELRANPTAFMALLCARLGINGTFYHNYRYNVHNKSVNTRYSFINKASIQLEPVTASLRTRLLHTPRLHHLFERVVRMGKSGLQRFNNRPAAKGQSISMELWQKLADFYQPANLALAAELQRPLPWKSYLPPHEET